MLASEYRGGLGPWQWIVREKEGDLYFSGFCCFIGRSQNFALSKHFSSFRNWIQKGWQKFQPVMFDLRRSLFYG